MVKLNKIEDKIKTFRERFDYSVYYEDDKKFYFILSENLRQVVSPFPRLSRDRVSMVDISGRKSEEHTQDGNYFSYEEGINGFPDRFSVLKGHELDKKGKFKAEKQKEEVIK
jgi:hypothetical protein